MSNLAAAKRSIGSSPWICVDAEPGAFAFFTWQNVLVSVWLAGGTGAAVERHARALLPLGTLYPRGVSTIHLVKSGAGMPTAEARAGFVSVMNDHHNLLACVAVSLLGRGFWASALQGAVTGMRMLAPRSFEMRIHDDTESILEWLPDEHLKRTGVFLDRVALKAAIDGAFAEATSSPSVTRRSSPTRS